MIRRVRSRSALLAAVLGLAGPGCAAEARPAAPVAPSAAAPSPAPPETAGPAAPSPLPFRLPCANDDLAGCTQGCAEKQVEDCVTLGAMYLAGAGVSTDGDRAVSLFREACDAGSARGCLRLGDAYHAGLGPGDVEAVSCYRRACDAGANLGCVAAARAYLAGQGVAVDPSFAATLFKRVCDRGNAPACFELGRLYAAGEGVKADRSQAMELYRKACKLGLDEGCLAAGGAGEVLPPRD
jgi:uncharacterized protein